MGLGDRRGSPRIRGRPGLTTGKDPFWPGAAGGRRLWGTHGTRGSSPEP